MTTKEIVAAARAAAEMLSDIPPTTGQYLEIALGAAWGVEQLREMARDLGTTTRVHLHTLMVTNKMIAIESFDAEVGRVHLRAQCSRPLEAPDFEALAAPEVRQ